MPSNARVSPPRIRRRFRFSSNWSFVRWRSVSYLPVSAPRIRIANAPYRRRPITTINRITTQHSRPRDKSSGNLSFAFILGPNGRPPLADVTVRPSSVAGISNVSSRHRVFLLTASFVYLCVSRIGRPADTFSRFYRAVAPYYHRSRVVLFWCAATARSDTAVVSNCLGIT